MCEIGEGKKICENVWCPDLGDGYMSVHTYQNALAEGMHRGCPESVFMAATLF